MFPESKDTVAQEEIGHIKKVDEVSHIVLILFLKIRQDYKC